MVVRNSMPHEKLLEINRKLKQVVQLFLRDIYECTSSVNRAFSYSYLSRFKVI